MLNSKFLYQIFKRFLFGESFFILSFLFAFIFFHIFVKLLILGQLGQHETWSIMIKNRDNNGCPVLLYIYDKLCNQYIVFPEDELFGKCYFICNTITKRESSLVIRSLIEGDRSSYHLDNQKPVKFCKESRNQN